jgi:seryl-tRNA synthetase
MPVDLVYFRGEEEGKILQTSQEMRFDQRQVNLDKIIDPASTSEATVPIVDAVQKLDALWKENQYQCEQGRQQINALGKEIAQKSKAKEPIDELKAKSLQLKADIAEYERLSKYYEEERNKYQSRVGNIVHESVPKEQDEAFNAIIRTWGEPQMKAENLHHHHLLHMIDGYAAEQGSNVAGHRGYFLTEAGLMLNQALIRYGIASLRKKQYKAMQPPFFMKKDVMAKTAQLEEFDEALYKVTGESNQGDFYLIATSEQPISAYHLGEWMDPSKLPQRYCGISSCFRKEAGSHGKDAWGIFRVHQFEKVEQFVLCSPEESWQMLDEMVSTSESFIKSLGLPYRVVTIVSGALNNAAAKKFDIEAWFPTLGVYRELVSCSNCTDYQSRAMETRYGLSGKNNALGAKQYVHMLNGTLCATTRTLCCILENYQNEKGILVPKVLRKYMDWTAEAEDDLDNDELWTIPFVKEKPEHEAGVGGAEIKARKEAAKKAAATKAKPE